MEGSIVIKLEHRASINVSKDVKLVKSGVLLNFMQSVKSRTFNFFCHLNLAPPTPVIFDIAP